MKEAKQYISRGEKLGNCEHENGFKLVDPDSTFYDTHELYDFECVDCGITAMGDVEPNFRYFGESNEKYLDLSAETFNAEHPDTGELLACPHCEKEVDWLETKASIISFCIKVHYFSPLCGNLPITKFLKMYTPTPTAVSEYSALFMVAVASESALKVSASLRIA